MIPPIYESAIVYASLLTLLSIGLTLTYLTTRVPNFAHATFGAVGVYVAFTVIMIWKGNIYHHLYLPFIIGGTAALAQYLIVFKPLMRRGASVVGLMITTLAIEFILLAILNIYADYLLYHKIKSKYFTFKLYDINIAGQSGILIVAPILAAATVILLHLTLTRTKFGVAMRAAIEDASLASVVGVNVNLVYAISWFISGALAGLSGALLPFHSLSYPEVGSVWIVSVFAASIIGGLMSVYGAVLGGFLIGFAEIIITNELAAEIGTWVVPYRRLIPLIAIAVTLLLAPNGLLGVDWRGTTKDVWGKVVGFIRSPTETFNNVKDEDWRSSIKHYLKLLVLFAILQTVLFVVIPEYYTLITSFTTMFLPIRPFLPWPPLLGLFCILLGGLIIILITSLLTHIFTYVLGSKRGMRQTIKSVAYGSTPLLLLGWIPFLGIIFAIWSLVVSTKGIRQLHEISTEKAIITIISGAILTLAIFIAIAFTFK
jgi:branched-chain amino acid transport system permease protein